MRINSSVCMVRKWRKRYCRRRRRRKRDDRGTLAEIVREGGRAYTSVRTIGVNGGAGKLSLLNVSNAENFFNSGAYLSLL